MNDSINIEVVVDGKYIINKFPAVYNNFKSHHIFG